MRPIQLRVDTRSQRRIKVSVLPDDGKAGWENVAVVPGMLTARTLEAPVGLPCVSASI